MDYFSALLEPGDLFTLKQAFQGQGNAMLIGYDLPRLDCTALSTPADESSPIHLILTWYGEGHSLFLNPNLKHKKVMSFRNVRVVLWIAPPSDLFIFNVDKYSNYVRNDRSTNLVYLFDEAPGLRDIKVTRVEDCWLGRFNLLFKVDNLQFGKDPADAAMNWSLTSPRTKHSLRRPGLIRFAIVATAHYSKADTISYPISKLSSIFPDHVSLTFDDNMELGTQGSQPIFNQYHKTYGEILTGFPAKDIRKQYESQTSHTSIEPDDGSFSQDDTGAVNFNLEPFQLHDGVRTSSGDVDESIETGSAFENPRDDPMLPTLQTQPNCRPERSRVSLEPATNPRHSGGSCSLEVDHDPQESLVGNEGQDSDLDLDWANTFRHRRLAKRRQERAAASLGRIRFPRPTAKSQKYTKALLADRAKAKIQNCTRRCDDDIDLSKSMRFTGQGRPSDAKRSCRAGLART
ncbi:hypothetical protein PG999_004545 [Apiospora kogelbergensis]|uniref:FHA domain-containing protein n=1 Tax=Apiospora kogelbergensis TaxID=1337665 RepID=A0AAW0QZL0_9PEZI